MRRAREALIGFVATALLLAGPLSVSVHAYGGGGEGGGGGREWGGSSTSGGGGTSWGPNIWDIDPDLTDATGEEIEGGTVDLGNPMTSQLQQIFVQLGGEQGTGQSFDDWMKSSRAAKAMVQISLEGEQGEAAGEAAGAHRTVVVLEWVDWAGQKVQVVLGFCPPLSAPWSVTLDAGRTFADAYNKALGEGKSTAEAIEIGMKQAAMKGVTTAITAGTLGNAAGDTWNKAKNINPNSVKSVAKAGANLIGTGALKTGENVINDLADAGRNAISNAPANQAPQPTYATPAPDMITKGGHTVYK